eukprot:TRINITY_DN5719_c0_g1_i1.p1 TRINITY_DN5719_c0_g1~~TRINITY_DN5719_c0_g1_i1.p1  ORF type:complete len:261 (+),score=63.84 TRINITY_DN5719_c0_g1_i1:317-1099(+)
MKNQQASVPNSQSLNSSSQKAENHIQVTISNRQPNLDSENTKVDVALQQTFACNPQGEGEISSSNKQFESQLILEEVNSYLQNLYDKCFQDNLCDSHNCDNNYQNCLKPNIQITPASPSNFQKRKFDSTQQQQENENKQVNNLNFDNNLEESEKLRQPENQQKKNEIQPVVYEKKPKIKGIKLQPITFNENRENSELKQENQKNDFLELQHRNEDENQNFPKNKENNNNNNNSNYNSNYNNKTFQKLKFFEEQSKEKKDN